MNHFKQLIKNTQAKPMASCAKSSTTKNENKKTAINASVIFGMPARNCAYNGICQIEKDQSFDLQTRRCISKAKIIRVGTKHLLFQFLKNEMHRLTIQKHFGSGYFVVLEDYEIPEFLGKALGQCAPVIRQGIYPILDKDEYYEVLF